MRSYALFVFACALLHARAASIPAPVEAEKKLPTDNDALDNVSMDNNVNEHELVEPLKTVRDVENSLRNNIPVVNVPVKVIEEKPVIKTISIDENSNDYVPDNDDSINIKRVEIDLKNPGPPQRQEHDSQIPGYYQDKERAIAAIRQSIAESENIFNRGIQKVSLKFKNYFANNENLEVVQENIKNLKETVNADLIKLSNTIDTCLNAQKDKPEEMIKKNPEITEVENKLKTLKTSFNTGVNMLSEGVEIVSILKEEEESDKILGKADNANIGSEPSGPTGASPENPTPTSSTVSPAETNQFFQLLNGFVTTISNGFTALGNSVQNLGGNNQNQNGSNNGTSNFNIFQNLNIPNIFQNQQNQNANNQAQGSSPDGAQADDASATERPNILQQIANNFQQVQKPFEQAFQSISSLFPWTGQGSQQTNPAPATNQPAPVLLQSASVQSVEDPAQGSNAVPAANAVQGSNVVPAPPAPQADPPRPAKETQPASAPVQGPIQQLVQNNPIVQGITHTVQRIQGLSNPSKPRETPAAENPDTKGHKPGGNNNGGDTNDNSGIVKENEPVKEEPQTITEVKNVEHLAVVEITKTE